MSQSKTPSSPTKARTGAARAKERNAQVIRDAGTSGHVLEPGQVPQVRWRTDLVDPILSFVVYGIPAAQGSKKGFVRGGKVVMKETSDYLAPWRRAVRQVSQQAIRDNAIATGVPWAAIDEPVVIQPVVTMEQSQASRDRGEIFANRTPDLDKMERAIGDAISPTPISQTDVKGYPKPAQKQIREKMMAERRKVAVLHDDALIVGWEHVCKVYPNTLPDSLGYPGVAIQVWLAHELHEASRTPLVRRSDSWEMKAGDVQAWARPLTGETWAEATRRLCVDSPQNILGQAASNQQESILLRGRGITDDGIRVVLAALMVDGPDRFIPVIKEAGS